MTADGLTVAADGVQTKRVGVSLAPPILALGQPIGASSVAASTSLGRGEDQPRTIVREIVHVDGSPTLVDSGSSRIDHSSTAETKDATSRSDSSPTLPSTPPAGKTTRAIPPHDAVAENAPTGPSRPPETPERPFRPPRPLQTYHVASSKLTGESYYPTISELFLPPGVNLSIQEINGGQDPTIPSVFEIDEHVLIRYREEEQRRQLEEQVHQRETELEREKEKNRVVSGLDNNDLNAMMRSFDKHVQDVHVCPPPYDEHIPQGLDLHPSPDEEFSVHKLTAALERLYSSVVVVMLRTFHEVQRIRHWEDGGHRTLITLAIYTYGWWCNLIFTFLFGFLSILIFSPSSRAFFFVPPVQPYAPAPFLDHEDKTRLAEKRQDNPWGPAGSEAKATTWAQNVQDIVKSLSSPKGSEKEASNIASGAQKTVEGRLQADMQKRQDAGNLDEGDEELSRKDKAIKLYAQPGLRFIGGISDKWERISNALNPAPGYMLRGRRTEVFLFLVLPPMLVATFTPAWVFAKASGAIFGFILFAQPLTSYIIDELDRTVPDWKERLVLEYNILETVPTNSQLVLRLLRNAEHRNNPIPPAPTEGDLDQDDDESDSSSDEEDEDSSGKDKLMQSMGTATVKVKQGTRAKARRAWDKLGHIKEEAFGVVTGHRHVDVEGKVEHAMEKAHINTHGKKARALLHKLPTKHRDTPTDPSCFYVRHHHHGPGHLIIYPPVGTSTPARIEFTTVRNVPASENALKDPRDDPVKGHLVVQINDIVGLTKKGKSLPVRTALGWALDAEGAGGTGLEIKVVRRDMDEAVRPDPNEAGKEETPAQGKEQVIKLESIVRRNELFDRLIAIGDQRWEMN